MPAAVRAAAPWLALVLVATGCALGGSGGAPAPHATRATDFRPAQLRQAVLLVHVVVAANAELSERDRKDLPALYEGLLLEALDARAVLVRDVRSADARGGVPSVEAAAQRAREVGADHALVVSLRVEPGVVNVCEETRRPLRGRADVWWQEARLVRAGDGRERLREETAVPAVEADCDGSPPRRRGVAATTAAAVERLVGKVLPP